MTRFIRLAAVMMALLLAGCSHTTNRDDARPQAWLQPGTRVTLPPPGITPAIRAQQLLTGSFKGQTQSLLVMLFTLSTSFITAYVVGKALKVDGKTTVLIGVGTSICGGSAIAATAPVIRAEDEDVAQAISTIFLFNIIAVFIFPALGHMMGMTDTQFGMWAGTAINDTSSVVAAGASWSSAAGNNTALAFATIVKLTRTLMIVPITLVLAFYTTKKIAREKAMASADGELSAQDGGFSFVRVFPWFVLGFVATAILNTLLPIPAAFSGALVKIGKFMIIMAMTAIGMNTNLKKLLTNGIRPICLGLCCWFMVAVVSLIVQHFTL